jgi:hypothetical protein
MVQRGSCGFTDDYRQKDDGTVDQQDVLQAHEQGKPEGRILVNRVKYFVRFADHEDPFLTGNTVHS